MTTTTITNFRKKAYEYVDQAIMYNNPVNVITKNGNAVVISEEEYLGMLATLEIMKEPGLMGEILEAAKEPIEECAKFEPDEEW